MMHSVGEGGGRLHGSVLNYSVPPSTRTYFVVNSLCAEGGPVSLECAVSSEQEKCCTVAHTNKNVDRSVDVGG